MQQKLTILFSAIMFCMAVSAQTVRIGRQRVELTAYPASAPDGTAVIVCPGGSYFWHDMVSEGDSVGRWLQREGISAFVSAIARPTYPPLPTTACSFVAIVTPDAQARLLREALC